MRPSPLLPGMGLWGSLRFSQSLSGPTAGTQIQKIGALSDPLNRDFRQRSWYNPYSAL